MIESTTTSTTTVAPAVMADILDLSDPQSLVDAHAGAVAGGQVSLAEEIARFVAHVGQELRATTARVDHDLLHTHEALHEGLWVEHDAAVDKLNILQGVPALVAAIDGLPEADIAAIWDMYGPYDDGDAEDEEENWL